LWNKIIRGKKWRMHLKKKLCELSVFSEASGKRIK
jgi:hypothetical protein